MSPAWSVTHVPVPTEGHAAAKRMLPFTSPCLELSPHGLSEAGVHPAGGRVAGGTASLLTDPEQRIAVAVATNVSGAGNVSLLAARLADVFIRLLETR